MNPCVYRFFDKKGDLVYIGQSIHMISRLAAHSGYLWFPEVVEVKIQHFDTVKEAKEAEKIAIFSERPKRNSAYMDRSPKYSDQKV